MQTDKHAWKKHSGDTYVQRDAEIGQALGELVEQIRQALQRYEALCRTHGVEPDGVRVESTRRWLKDEGRIILSSLRRKMQTANEVLRGDMLRSINAAVASGKMAEERDMSVGLHRDMLWEWADQIILSMEAAFRPFPEGFSFDRFIEPGLLRKPCATGRTPMWPPETKEGDTEPYVEMPGGSKLETPAGGMHAA